MAQHGVLGIGPMAQHEVLGVGPWLNIEFWVLGHGPNLPSSKLNGTGPRVHLYTNKN